MLLTENNGVTIYWLELVNSRLKLSLNKTTYSQNCLKLVSLDSWDILVYSNMFYIILNENKPPALTHSLDPFVVPKGVYTLFELPDDLFIDYDNSPLFYNASIISWSQNHFFDIGIKSKSNNKLILS